LPEKSRTPYPGYMKHRRNRVRPPRGPWHAGAPRFRRDVSDHEPDPQRKGPGDPRRTLSRRQTRRDLRGGHPGRSCVLRPPGARMARSLPKQPAGHTVSVLSLPVLEVGDLRERPETTSRDRARRRGSAGRSAPANARWTLRRRPSVVRRNRSHGPPGSPGQRGPRSVGSRSRDTGPLGVESLAGRRLQGRPSRGGGLGPLRCLAVAPPSGRRTVP
jgi:hypothetical protein